MKRIAVALVALSLLAACGSDSKKSASTTSTPDGGSVPSAESVPVVGEPVDPSVTEGCEILTPEQMASILGQAEDPYNPNLTSDEVTDCQWYTDDGRSIGFQIQLLTAAGSQLLRSGEPVDVGAEAYVEGGDFPRFEGTLHGWDVLIFGLNGPVTTDDVVALGRLLDSVLAERTTTGGDGGEDVVGTLTDMSVTIDSPANLAGTMTLADLQAQTTSLALCGGPWTLNSIGKIFTVVYEYGVMTGSATSPAPVVGLSLEVQGDYTGQGVYVAKMRFATNTAEVNGVGSMTVDPGELTGSFTYSDASGTITGHWMCAGS